MRNMFRPEVRRVVNILDDDPDLAAEITASQWPSAREAARALEVHVGRGPWLANDERPEPGAVGFLILEGTLCVSRTIGQRSSAELLGPGDVVQPWAERHPDFTVASAAEWWALAPMRLAQLDWNFSLRLARWPQIAAALMHRLVLRSQRLAIQLTIAATPSADDAVLNILWALADRWGVMTAHGVELRLRLTHEIIARLIGIRRPTVSVALARLRTAGRLTAGPHGLTLLGRPPSPVAALDEQVGVGVGAAGARAAAAL